MKKRDKFRRKTMKMRREVNPAGDIRSPVKLTGFPNDVNIRHVTRIEK